MERLTKRDAEGNAYWNGKNGVSYSDIRGNIYGNAIDKLAAYEDAEEQGLLYRLPCKAYDTAWCALEGTRYFYCGLYEVTVIEIDWSINRGFEVTVRFKDGEQPYGYINFYSHEFGERIFFGDNARAEAEAALERMKGDKNE